MDEAKALEPAPLRLTEIPEHTRIWLASLEPEDIARFRKWTGFITWAEQTGRYGRVVMALALVVFGAMATISGGWDATLKLLHIR